MKKWLRTSLLTTVALVIILLGITYLLDINISMPSSNIPFSPGQPMVKEIPAITEKPTNVIIFIADGMGFSHLSLSLMTQTEENEPPIWQAFDVKGWHDARCTYGPITDSGASATAMATGTSTFFDVIGQDADGNRVENVFELASQQGYNTGIVTDSYIWDATPAAFVAHTPSRDNAKEILTQMAASELDLIFGELEDVGEGEEGR